MGLLAAVPTGSEVSPCCCECFVPEGTSDCLLVSNLSYYGFCPVDDIVVYRVGPTKWEATVPASEFCVDPECLDDFVNGISYVSVQCGHDVSAEEGFVVYAYGSGVCDRFVIWRRGESTLSMGEYSSYDDSHTVTVQEVECP